MVLKPNGVMRRPAKKPSPESEFFRGLVGRKVLIGLLLRPDDGKFVMRGILGWVDKYSIGIRAEGETKETLVYKHSIVDIALD
jgi:hypothetical protein